MGWPHVRDSGKIVMARVAAGWNCDLSSQDPALTADVPCRIDGFMDSS